MKKGRPQLFTTEQESILKAAIANEGDDDAMSDKALAALVNVTGDQVYRWRYRNNIISAKYRKYQKAMQRKTTNGQ